MAIFVGSITIVLIAAAVTLEIVIAGKRGGCLSSFRVFTVAIAGVIGVGLAFLLGHIFVNDRYISLPADLQPLVHDLAYTFAIPVLALLIFLFFKLFTLIVYAVVANNLKNGEHSEACNSADPAVRNKGFICGAIISVIVLGFLAMPIYRSTSLYHDYKVNEPSFNTILQYATGGKVSNSELISAIDNLTGYILDVNYVSEDAKVKAINYGIKTVNSMLTDVGGSALGNLSLETYDSIEEHKQQVETIVDIAKVLDETGILDIVTADNSSEAVIDADRIIDAISSEENARAFIEAIGGLDNGNEMLAEVINETIKEMSGGLMVNLIDEDAIADESNVEALIQTMTHATTFLNLSMEDFQNMSNEEKQELINSINEISKYGIVDSSMMDIIISQIEATMN